LLLVSIWGSIFIHRIETSAVRLLTTRIVGSLMEQVVQPVLAKAGHVLLDGKRQG